MKSTAVIWTEPVREKLRTTGNILQAMKQIRVVAKNPVFASITITTGKARYISTMLNSAT